MVAGVFRNRQHRCDALFAVEWQQIDHWPTLGATTALGNLEYPQPIHFAEVRKTQQRVVRVGDHQMLNKVFIFYRGSRLAAATPSLGLVGVQRLGFCITLVGYGHHQLFFSDQVFVGQILLTGYDFGASLVAIGVANIFQFATNHADQALVRTQNIQQVGNLVEHALVVLHELALLHGG